MSERSELHAKKKTFHMVGHHRVRAGGDTAAVTVKGYAYNVLDDDLGGGMWEVWGDYDVPLPRPASFFRIDRLPFDLIAKHSVCGSSPRPLRSSSNAS